MIYRRLQLVILHFCLVLLLIGCTDPIVPAYQFETGFLLVEGSITDTEGYSEIRLSRNALLFGNYTLIPITDATVSVIDGDGVEVAWVNTPETGSYRAPANWAGVAGQTYQLRALTPEGEILESKAEIMPGGVPITNAEIRFEQEAYFSVGRDRFIPAFILEVDLNDPAEEENFYQFRYTVYGVPIDEFSHDRHRTYTHKTEHGRSGLAHVAEVTDQCSGQGGI